MEVKCRISSRRGKLELQVQSVSSGSVRKQAFLALAHCTAAKRHMRPHVRADPPVPSSLAALTVGADFLRARALGRNNLRARVGRNNLRAREQETGNFYNFPTIDISHRVNCAGGIGGGSCVHNLSRRNNRSHGHTGCSGVHAPRFTSRSAMPGS